MKRKPITAVFAGFQDRHPTAEEIARIYQGADGPRIDARGAGRGRPDSRRDAVGHL